VSEIQEQAERSVGELNALIEIAERHLREVMKEETNARTNLSALLQERAPLVFGWPVGTILSKKVRWGFGSHAQDRIEHWRVLGFTRDCARVIQVRKDGSDGARFDIISPGLKHRYEIEGKP
jgi:hypothetical protein